MNRNKEFTELFPLDFTDAEIYDTVQSSIENYYYHGLDPGGFVYHMLSNNLVEAIVRADSWNRLQMYQNAIWLVNKMPAQAWGSEEKVKEWMASFNQ